MVNKANSSVAKAGGKLGGVGHLPQVSPVGVGLPRQTRVQQPFASRVPTRFDQWAQFPQQSVSSASPYHRMASPSKKKPKQPGSAQNQNQAILKPVPSVGFHLT